MPLNAKNANRGILVRFIAKRKICKKQKSPLEKYALACYNQFIRYAKAYCVITLAYLSSGKGESY